MFLIGEENYHLEFGEAPKFQLIYGTYMDFIYGIHIEQWNYDLHLGEFLCLEWDGMGYVEFSKNGTIYKT